MSKTTKNVEEAEVKIKELRVHVAEVDLGAEFFNPRILWARKQAVFVEIEDTSGTCGWGECWTFDNSADSLVRFIQTEIRPVVLGREIHSIEDAWQELWSTTVLSGRHGMTAATLSGLDCALWDISAQLDGVSLGSAIASREPLRPVPIYASGGLYSKGGSLADLHGEMSHYVDQGYRCVKMKFGALDFEQDLERMLVVRDAIGTETALIVDAVYSLDRTKAERWLPEWRALEVEAVQAPFPARDWESIQWLNQDCEIPVMVFEAESRYVVFRALLERQAIGVMQFSPIAVGGVTASLALIELAESFDCPVSLQCSSTWVVELIALQIASAKSSVRHVEMHGFHKMMFEHANQAHRRLKDGCIDLGSAPGLGFRPPDGCLAPFDTGLPDLAKF